MPHPPPIIFKDNIFNKTNHEYFITLYELICCHPLSFFNILRTQKYIFLKKWIDDSVPKLKDDIYGLSTKCYWIMNGMIDFPVCKFKNCKNRIGVGKNVKITKGYPSYCCNSHAQKSYEVMEKRKNTTRKNYGVDFPIQNLHIHEKIKRTCMQTFGVENPFQSDRIKEKSMRSLIERYGVDNPGKSKLLRQKTKDTCIKKYGESSFSRTQEFIEKAKSTNLKNRGVEFPSQSKEVQEKFQHTCKLKYNEFHPMRHNAVKEKCMKNKSRSYQYNNMQFDSAPELALYIFLKDHNVEFKFQPDADFKYIYDGKTHKYFPDFEIDGKYVELKGNQFLKEDGSWQCPYDHSLDELYEAKHQCLLENDIKIMYANEYRKYLDYVEQTYGKGHLKKFICRKCHMNPKCV